MHIQTFKVEEWMNEYEKKATCDVAQTCVNTLTLDELFKITNTDKSDFFNKLCKKPMGYGFIQGSPDFKKGICKLYETIKPGGVIPTIGAAGANHLVFYSIVKPQDRVISVIPTYQQLYSIPESFGADVKHLNLKPENGFLPDLDELCSLISDRTKLICLNNPNNPTGALMDEKMLKEIVKIARDADVYILCDEVYRGLNQSEEITPSIADLYEKGISVSSMSKVFSLAGLRLGWVASNCKEVIDECLKHREYNMISCSIGDEMLASLALENADIIIERNKKIIRENLKILEGWVESEPLISYTKPKSGTTALIYYDLDMSSKDFCHELCEQEGVFLTPGFCFELEGCARIGYACKREVLEEGLAKISRFLKSNC